MARVSVFDPALNGGSYLLKPDQASADPGDAYESNTFGAGLRPYDRSERLAAGNRR
jgi:hypothetical protein